ncbi:MAG: helix-turn-helix transcriptional regulator [Bauldia sp.]|nr:helix-turn-helix transcriptional regulator [Bauldia sp.]
MDELTAIESLAALSQESRLRVFRSLVQAGPEGLAAGVIALELDIVPNTLSTHLAQLTRAGLIRRTRDGRIIRYAADNAGIRALLTYLLEDCCQGRPELCRPAVATVACC